jgi:hypothetical protein
MPRKDLEFCQIFKELFICVIDSLLFSPSESRLKLVHKKTCWCNIHQGIKTPVIDTLGSLDFLVYLSPESFLVNLLCGLFKHAMKSTPWCIHHEGVIMDTGESFK